jgi:SAM-dependent methyltransferase
MPGPQISEYYDATEDRDIRSDLAFALSLVGDLKIAVDCGCGAGADIDYLLANEFEVYGFDIENESISRCETRFKNSENVVLTRADFVSYDYPRASLVVADASLFFCPMSYFDDVWTNISDCLNTDGVFCGSFLGPEDTMAGPAYDKNAFWPDVSVFDEEEVRGFFTGFEIYRFTEHKSSGSTPEGKPHDWHIYSVVAKKSDK